MALPGRAQYVTAGANPISVKKGIDKTCEFLVAQLKEKAQPVKGASDIKARAPRRARPARGAAAARPGRRRWPLLAKWPRRRRTARRPGSGGPEAERATAVHMR